MSKRQQAKPARTQRRIFPSGYTRADLIEYVTALGAECHEQSVVIEALTQRVHELENQSSDPARVSRRLWRLEASRAS